MTIYNRPDATVPVWAESGDKVQPTDPEIQTGWPLSNTPPSRQRFNWILGEVAEAVRYLLQRGIAEWSADEDYPINARVQHLGTLYTAVAANIGVTPGTDPSKWILGASSSSETPPQFDDDTSIATTAFVKRQGLQAAGRFQFNANQVLTVAHIGGSVIAFGTGAIAFTLPAANAVPAGARICISSQIVGQNLTLNRAGADVIVGNGSNAALTSAALLPGDNLILESNGSNSWNLVGGSAALRYSGAMGALLTASGWQRLPSGLIIQWDQVVAPGTHTFPIAFPNECFNITITSNANAANFPFSNARPFSKTGFTSGNSGGGTIQANYFALGW